MDYWIIISIEGCLTEKGEHIALCKINKMYTKPQTSNDIAVLISSTHVHICHTQAHKRRWNLKSVVWRGEVILVLSLLDIHDHGQCV